MIQRLSHELRPERFLPSLAGGLVTGIISVTYATAFNALIFTGDLTAYLPVVVIWTLLGSAFQAVLTAWFSSLPSTISSIQDSSAVVLAMTAVMITRAMPAAASSQEKFMTVAAAVAICTVLTGLLFLFLGQFKLGDLIRYLPYPVIGGFLAGSGLLLVLGGAAVMTGINIDLSSLPALFQPGVLLKWLPGMLYGVVLMTLLLRVRHFMVLPGALLAGVAGFYLILWLGGISMVDARAQGLLLSTKAIVGGGWQPFGWPGGANSLSYVDWGALAGQAGSLVAVALVVLITLLLNATGIELDNGLTLDFNRELKASGIANLVSGPLGCMPGAHGLGNTSLVYKMGGRSRMAAFVVAGTCLFAMIFGDTLVSFFPTPILGGLLMLLGFDFLMNWLYQTWFKLPILSYLTIVLIALVMVAVGVLQGVALGLGLAIVAFVVAYSRVRIVRHTLTGVNFQSKASRPRVAEQFLRENGERVYILELQGYIFFGTANKLLDQVSRRIAAAPEVDFVILDFRMVPGLDSSAALSFSRLKQVTQQHQIVLVFTHLSPAIRKLLDKDLFSAKDSAAWRIFPDLDHGLEWCENQILASGPQTEAVTLMAELRKSLAIAPERLMRYFERIEVQRGQCIIRQGEPSPGLYFVESGLATVQLECGPQTQVRLRTLHPGTVVGEMGLYLGGDTSAAVYANEPTTLFHLSPARLEEMETEAPEVAAAFHKLIARRMGEKLRDTTESLGAVLV
jgi:SulP family sulfate permease